MHQMAAQSRLSEYNIQASSNTADPTADLLVARGLTLFHITAHHALLQDAQFFPEYEQRHARLREQLRQYVSSGVKSEPWVEPYEFLCEQLLPVFRRLAPDISMPRTLTLQDVVAIPTYTLQVTGAGDLGIAGEEAGITYTPGFMLSPRLMPDLPESCKDIPRVNASRVWIEPRPNASGAWWLEETVLLDDGTQKRFVGCTRLNSIHSQYQSAFERELRILGQIKTADLNAGEIRLPDLIGIVEFNKTIVGMLLEHVSTSPRGKSMLSVGFWEDEKLCAKWRSQVTETLKVLHANGIVWGTVNPANVLIDEKLDAWIINFSGAHTRAFIDDGLLGTEEGDWQGVKRLFDEWAPSRRVDAPNDHGIF